jgi:T5SS/PEP-CTERM-associated repeat protein
MISTAGNVTPTYPGVGVDPWNTGSELVIGNAANGSLSVGEGSDIISAGGTIAFSPNVVGTAVVTGSGSTWTNNQDLIVGVFGSGQLSVLQGAQVSNHGASLGHINGAGSLLVADAGSEWLNSDDVFIGNGASGSMAIQNQGRATGLAAWLGLNSTGVGTATIDGQNSRWEIAQTLALGDASDGGQATVTLSGAGSRLYVGPAAVTAGSSLPATQTAVVISDTTGVAAVSIYAGNKLHNSGYGYMGINAGESGSASIVGAGSEWANSGAVSIGVAGSASLTLDSDGTLSATGLVTIGEHGLAKGNGTIAADTLNSGAVAPGIAEGKLNVTGSYTQSATGKLQIELYGAAPGQFDELAVTGSAVLGGELDVTLGTTAGHQFEPQLGDSFTFLTTTSGALGYFASAHLPGLTPGRMWQIRYAADSTTLAVALAGDYNDDTTVDAADYVIWRKLNGSSFNPSADGDTNGAVNAGDFTIWRSRFGASAGAAASLSSGDFVPEPATVVLLTGGVVALATRGGRGERGRLKHSLRLR